METMASDQRLNCTRSVVGMPSISAITMTGSGPAKRIRKQVKEEKEKKEKLIKCECGAEYEPAPECPPCGKKMDPAKEYVEEVPVELVLSDGKPKKVRPKPIKINWNKEKSI